MAVHNNLLLDAIVSLDVNNIASVASFVEVFDEAAKALAGSEQLRATTGSAQPSIWPSLRTLWITLSIAHTKLLQDDGESFNEKQLQSLCVSLARFTRNLVAAVPHNQEQAFENERAIRQLLHYYTSYTVIQDKESFLATRMLTQALSNIITNNEELVDKLLHLYLQLPDEQLILIRLMGIPDAGTALSTLVLILNCLTGNRTEGPAILINSRSGVRLCITYLDRMDSLFKDSETLPEAGNAFDVGYRVFSTLAAGGVLPTLFSKIAIPGEVVSPHQTTLLKLLDSYLQPSNYETLFSIQEHIRGVLDLLVTTFFSLANYTQNAVRRALGPNNARTPTLRDSGTERKPPTGHGTAEAVEQDTAEFPSDRPLQEIDLLLPKVCEALVLVTQCCISLALFSEDSRASLNHQTEADIPLTSLRIKDNINEAVSPDGLGSVEALLETLRLLDVFLPRITFGKLAPPAVSVGDKHVFVPEQTQSSDSNPTGFQYLKRDLVRLLGILVSDRKAIQDRVRKCSGIEVVLNLCVVDERNPFLREHAIFTLRNLLHSNPENQAAVHEIQPLTTWENGLTE